MSDDLLSKYAIAREDASRSAWTGPEWVPKRLSMAVQHALLADAAGLSMITNKLRVPLGASNPAAELAERLQVTVGEGPCLAALAEKRAISVSDADMAARWPTFYELLIEQTPFRSITSAPLQGGIGALDVYWRDPEPPAPTTVTAVGVLARYVSIELLAAPTQVDADVGQQPDWLNSPPAHDRMTVWQAVGMIMGARKQTSDDALALLRGRAYSASVTLDETARQLVAGHISVDTFADLRER